MTNTKMILGSVLFAALLGASAWSAAVKSDSDTLQGTWKGREIGAQPDGPCYLTVSGKNLEFHGVDTNEWYKGTFTLREDAHPKQLIAKITGCPAPEYVGQTGYAIYKIEDGTLTLSGNEPGKPEAPASFDAPGARQFVFKAK